MARTRILSIASLFAIAAAFGKQWGDRVISASNGPARKSVFRQLYSINKFTPHQGKRECMRRRMGGFHALRRLENENAKHLAMLGGAR